MAQIVDPGATADRADAVRPGRGRLGVAGTVAAVGLFVAVALLPWEWSFIDDTGLIWQLEMRTARHGRLGGIWHTTLWLADLDRSWGLFRPAFYLYVPLFYQLPVGVAHAVRVAMLTVAFVGAVALAVRDTGGRHRLVMAGWALLVSAAGGAVYAGIWYPSLQELSGLCLVGLGMLAHRRPWLVIACWLVAAWFKSPFAWLPLALGVLLVRQRSTRRVGIAAAVLALATLGAAVLAARGGTYTAPVRQVTVAGVVDRLLTAVGHLDAALVVVVLGVVLFARRGWRPSWDTYGVAILAGGAGYLGTLLAWRTEGYYAGPYVFLLSIGALLVLRPRDTAPLPRARIAAGFTVLTVLAGVSAGLAANTGWRIHQTVTGLRDCVLAQPAGSDFGFNRSEASPRLGEIVQRHRPGWTGRVARVAAGDTQGWFWAERVTQLDYYIYDAGYGPGTPALRTGPTVCRTPNATVYRVGPQ